MHQTAAQFVQLSTVDDCRALHSHPDLPPFDANHLHQHRPDAHWAIVEADVVQARCSLWWQNTPPSASHQVGLIGHYAAATETAAAALLEFACRQLSEAGCSLAVGPMNGNTWRDYRFVTKMGDEPRFILEPHNPPQWPAQFVNHGFQVHARYFSALSDDLTVTTQRVRRVQQRMARQNILLRSLSADTFESDLRQIHAVAQVAFRNHILYQTMHESEFLQQYEALRAIVPFDLVLIAEQQGRAVGFGFALPKQLQAARGETVDTVIIKTLGVLPGREFAGLGQLLLEQLQQRASQLGYRRAIHALVGETGPLQKISRRYAVPFRQYTLFSKKL